MKLLSCHIENFGKLKDLTYYFEDDLNVLFAENGWGKSTFAAFLKVMFYGFDGENRRNEDGNERLRYKPWGGGVYGGSVTWSCGSKNYRMMRTFGARKKEDIFALYDDETGMISNDFSEQTGEELFGIDRDSFRRTVFWSQSDHETSATTSIQAKIGDLSAQQDDLPAYDAAVRRLRREMERLRPDRASGLIRKKEDRLAVLEADEARLPSLSARLRECTQKEEQLSAELDRIRMQKQQYALAVPGDPAPGSAESQNTASDSAPAETAPLEKALKASEKRLSALTEKNRSTVRRGQKEREEYLRLKKALQRELAAISRQQEQQRSAMRRAAVLCIVCAAVLSAVCLAGHLSAPVLIFPVLFALLGGSLFWRSTRINDNLRETEEILRLRTEKEWYNRSLCTLRERMRHTQEQILEEKQRGDALRIRIRQAKADPPVKAAAPVKSSSDGPLSAEVSQRLSEFDRKEEKCRSELQQIQLQSEELRAAITDCRSSQEALPALRSEINTLRKQYDICMKTLSYLGEARNSFTSRYMNPFMRSFRRYYGMLTGESAESLQTDADFSITILDGGLPRDPSLMSEGTRDLISLCRRMAMIDAMYPGEKPFLVLDDPFSNLDDERVKGGLRFLHSASLEYQILYLTCHASRM